MSDCQVESVVFQKRLEDDSTVFYIREKFPSGMTAELSFSVYLNPSNHLEASPSLVIYRKRKHAWTNPNEITGKDGVLPLLWALKMLEHFEEYLFSQYRRYDTAVFWVTWSNEHRGKAYKKMLKKKGYSLVYEYNEFGLKKVVSKKTPLRSLFP